MKLLNTPVHELTHDAQRELEKPNSAAADHSEEYSVEDLAHAVIWDNDLALRIVCQAPHLLKENPLVDTDYNQDVPLLHAACELNKEKLAEALLDAGANIDEQADTDEFTRTDEEEDWYDYYYTPMLAAHRYNSSACLRLLVARGALLTLSGNLNYLHIAAFDKNYELALVILQYRRISPDIFYALGFGFTEEAENIIHSSRWMASERLLSPEPISSDYGRNETPLHWAARSCSAAIPALARTGVDLDAVDDYNRTALHWAIDVGNEDSVQELLAYGASQLICSSDGKTPLQYALWLEDDYEGNDCIQNIVNLLRRYRTKKDEV